MFRIVVLLLRLKVVKIQMKLTRSCYHFSKLCMSLNQTRKELQNGELVKIGGSRSGKHEIKVNPREMWVLS